MNISVPPKLKEQIELAVRMGGYASKSEFLRDAVRTWHEQQLLKGIIQSEEDIAQGRVVKLKSLKDLR